MDILNNNIDILNNQEYNKLINNNMSVNDEYNFLMDLFIKNKECIIDKRFNTLETSNKELLKRTAYNNLGDYLINSDYEKLATRNPVLLSNTINALYQKLLYDELLKFLNITNENKLLDYYNNNYSSNDNTISDISNSTLIF